MGTEEPRSHGSGTGSMLPPPWLVRGTLVCVCGVVLALTSWLVARALMSVVVVTASVAAALLLTALLQPVAGALQRLRAPRWAAALLTVLLALAVVTGVGALLVTRARSQLTELREATAESIERIHDLVRDAPLPVSEVQWSTAEEQLQDAVLAALPDPAVGTTVATQVLTALALTVFLWFFLLKDGDRMWAWALGWAPRGHRDGAERAGRATWEVLTGYVRGTTVIAAADALGVGIALLVLDVPLTASLTLLVFLGAFVPIVGAFVSGGLAVAVTLVAVGPVPALVLAGCVLLVQQIEGNFLQPLVMGRTLQLHPVVIVLSVTLGALLGGVLGALVAVPLVAVAYRLAQQQRDGAR